MNSHSEHSYQIVRTLADGLRIQVTSLDSLDEAQELVATLPKLWSGAYSIQEDNSLVDE